MLGKKVGSALTQKYGLGNTDDKILEVITKHRKRRMERPYGLSPRLFEFTQQSNIDQYQSKTKKICEMNEQNIKDWEARQAERLEYDQDESVKKQRSKKSHLPEEPKSSTLIGKSQRNLSVDASFSKRVGGLNL